MLTLYGVYRSRASRPLWLLGEAGVGFRHIAVIQSDRLAQPNAAGAPLNTASPEFLAVSPIGQVPILEENGLVLSESLAIALYIARRHGGMLGPQTEAETALMEQWALFAATSVEGPARDIYNTVEIGGSATQAGQAGIAQAAVKLRRPLGQLQHVLDRHPFLVSDRFTVADINAAECLRYAQAHPALLAEYPSVQDWLQRCQSRPAFKAMWQRHEAEVD